VPTLDRVQTPFAGVKLPEAPPFENVTVPLGLVAPVAALSVTVAVQTEWWFTTAGESHETLVLVTWGAVTVTVRLTVVGVVVAPSGEPVTVKLYGPAATEEPTLIVKSLDPVGVKGLTVKLPQVIPDGRPEHDSATG
jgi:hypothetical protein